MTEGLEVSKEGDEVITDWCVNEQQGRNCENNMYDEEEGDYHGNHGYLGSVDPSQPLIQTAPPTRKHRVSIGESRPSLFTSYFILVEPR